MNRLKLGVDLDGVVADFKKTFCGRAHELFPDWIELPVWDFGLSKEQQDILWREIVGIHNFWMTLDRLPGTSQLGDMQYRHDFIYITSRTPTLGLPTWRQSAWWLKNQLRLTFPQVVVVDDPHEKLDVIKALKIDAFIDDKPNTVRELQTAGIPVWARLQSWNEADKDYPHIADVDHFIAVAEALLG